MEMERDLIMRWKQFLTPAASMSPQEAQQYIADHDEGSFTILDVRQPKEYKEEHLPGSTLIPLPELNDRLAELEKEKPIIVYCAVGGRSRMAAQLLAGQDFKEVYNLKGGIKAWQGQKAVGPAEAGMASLRGDETPEEILILAYGLEGGLEGFYREMGPQAENQETTDLFAHLASFEDSHKQKLFAAYQAYDASVTDRAAFETQVVEQKMEGGITLGEFLDLNAPAMQTTQEILDIAMMIEAQALDLYSRYAEKSQQEATQAVLFDIAQEEKRHLKAIGELKEKLL
ncbi:sulfurtransferase [candidate division KSB3 bacterium]|uniref:Sulfurtransferase n=1 Tax=candidate division KSB3 bacterium TaxID=2044937 RepID=A0A9D5JZJ8_9BACT|nr:sulfurtransferase [candidate division KSB3 bacterium]MBD3327109.1 sulfurtransferase [candidate division KSB3 bacterium]